MLKDIKSGIESSVPRFKHLNSAGTHILFRADDGVHGSELWKSDGTSTGTTMAAAIKVSGRLHTGGTDLFFAGTNSGLDIELWKFDTVSGGASLVKDILPGGESSGPSHLTDFAGGMLFAASAQGLGGELHFTDGTSNGTVLVKDIFPSLGSGSPVDFTVISPTLAIFAAEDGVATGCTSRPTIRSTAMSCGRPMAPRPAR